VRQLRKKVEVKILEDAILDESAASPRKVFTSSATAVRSRS